MCGSGGQAWQLPDEDGDSKCYTCERRGMAKGTIIRLVKSHGHIFILKDDGYELFFLRYELRGTAYESLREGQRVAFEMSWTASGARVVNMRLTGKQG